MGPAGFLRFTFKRFGLGESRVCPLLSMPEDWIQAAALFVAWKEGALYAAGGVGDQPARYVDCMRLIGNEVAAIEKAMIEDMKSKG